MKLSRNVTLWIHFLLDQCCPPLLRDSKWFMWLPFRLIFGSKARIFFEFKQRAPMLTAAEFREVYAETTSVTIDRDTDLNDACIGAIEANVVGESVLDVACGRGYLTKRLASKYVVTGVDVVLESSLASSGRIRYVEASIEELPFADAQFDTVVCTHTLEHVQSPQRAIAELRRVARRRLLVVLPRQRPYRYTFDLHLHFFPYRHDVMMLMRTGSRASYCESLGGDWFYREDRE